MTAKEQSTDVRTLILDIETMPLEAYVWGLWDQNINIGNIKEHGGMLSWSAKWLDDEHIYFSSEHHFGRKAMVESIWEMMDEADEVVGWNSNRFDVPHLNTEFLKMGLGPPSPYKKVDLMRTVKSVFKFPSNKLDYISQVMGFGQKVAHEGFPLWVACMEGDEEAWDKMREYNEHDVILTEQHYNKLLPWITTGVNRSAVKGGHVCPNCGSDHLHSRGNTTTLLLTYKRYQCQACGSWSRAKVAEKTGSRANQLVLAR